MTILELFLYCFLGILLSLFLPVSIDFLGEFRKRLRINKKAKSSVWNGLIKSFWKVVRPYVLCALASVVVGIVIVILFLASGVNLQETSPIDAILYGYAWDSTIQKTLSNSE